MNAIPAGWVQLPDGSYAHPRHVGKLVSSQPKPQGVERERDLHDAILEHCRFHGWLPHHSRMDVPATCGVGTPDFAIALPNGRTVWIEAKSRTGKLTPEQSAWIAGLKKLGHTAHVVRSMEEFREVVK